MRIDHVLCQKILIAIEEDERAGSGEFLRLPIEGYDQKQLNHHVKYLWDGKLIEGVDVTHMQSPYPEIMPQDITPAGRNFIDSLVPESEPKKVAGFSQV